jgi:ATP-dependent helicase HrpB
MSIDPDDATGLLLAFAYPDRIGMARPGEGGRYLLSVGRGAVLAGPSALARSEFIVAAALDAGEREAHVRLAAPLRRDLLETHFASAIEQRDEVGWDARTGQVIARRVRRLREILLEERPLDGDRTTFGVERAMLQGVRMLGLDALPWTPALRQWQARVLLLRAQEDSAGSSGSRWPDVSDASLLESLENWLEPYLSGMTRREHLARVDLVAALHALLDWNRRRQLDELAPTHVTVPSGSRIPIDYTQASPTLSVRLQEVFGWTASPRIAAGRTPLTLELLSPARRPMQVTRDLASFWARGYADVRKELKGRYPKHYWPDDPLTAVATRKVRPPQHE